MTRFDSLRSSTAVVCILLALAAPLSLIATILAIGAVAGLTLGLAFGLSLGWSIFVGAMLGFVVMCWCEYALLQFDNAENDLG